MRDKTLDIIQEDGSMVIDDSSLASGFQQFKALRDAARQAQSNGKDRRTNTPVAAMPPSKTCPVEH